MIDLFQLFLIIIIGSLTAMMIYIGLQIAAILKELKKTLSKMNQMIDKAEEAMVSINHSLCRAGSFFDGLGGIFQIINLLRGRGREKEDK